jgi:hypothetical protein
LTRKFFGSKKHEKIVQIPDFFIHPVIDDFLEKYKQRFSALPSTQKWGKKRHAFYGSYADADYGGVNDSEEEELLELEEEDAIARQKKADAAIAAIDYDALDHNLESDSDDDAEKTKAEKLHKDDFSTMSEKEQLEYFLKTCPEVEDMIMEYKDRVSSGLV